MFTKIFLTLCLFLRGCALASSSSSSSSPASSDSSAMSDNVSVNDIGGAYVVRPCIISLFLSYQKIRNIVLR